MRHILPFNTGIFAELNNIINETLGHVDTPTDNTEHSLYSTPEGWTAKVDLPGYAKEEIKLSFEDDSLALTATNETRGETKFTLSLGDEVEITEISAKLTNGVLEILLPKKEEVAPKNLSIEIQ